MAKNGERELFGMANALAVPNAMVYASMRNISAKDDLMATSEACIYEPLSGYLPDHDATAASREAPFMESFGLRDETQEEFDVSDATDELLITTAKSGDHPAFVELWTRHSKTAFNMAYRITGNRDDAEDVVQDAWMKAYTHLNTFDGRAKFSTWLTRIAINSALMILRRKRARPETSMEFTDGDSWQHWEIADQTKNVEELYARREAAQRLRRAICRLQPALRSVVEIHQSNDSSVKETAELAGISVAATKSRLLRARKILHRALS
jgi:RNA polymerase sigma-70 factor (ECF subfamily)